MVSNIADGVECGHVANALISADSVSGYLGPTNILSGSPPHQPSAAKTTASAQQHSPFHAPAASKVPTAARPDLAVPKRQSSPFPSLKPAAVPVQSSPSQSPDQAAASYGSSGAVDLTSPTMRPQSVGRITVDLTEEVCRLCSKS